jgi:hypothetical protein
MDNMLCSSISNIDAAVSAGGGFVAILVPADTK